MKPTVQWRGDNVEEFNRVLDPFMARARKDGISLHISGIGLKDIFLSPGDSIIIDGDQLGVSRLERGAAADERKVEWTGENVQEFANFLQGFNVDIDVVGRDLYLRSTREAKPIVLKPGDRLIRRGANVVVSIAGEHHRAG